SETITAFFGPNRIWRHDDFLGDGAIEGDENLNTSVRLRGGWEIESSIGRAFVQLDPADYAGIYKLQDDILLPYLPLDEVSGLALEFSVQTPTYHLFGAELELEHRRVAIFPEGSRGTNRAVELDLTLRPTQSIRMFLTGAYEQLRRERDG